MQLSSKFCKFRLHERVGNVWHFVCPLRHFTTILASGVCNCRNKWEIGKDTQSFQRWQCNDTNWILNFQIMKHNCNFELCCTIFFINNFNTRSVRHYFDIQSRIYDEIGSCSSLFLYQKYILHERWGIMLQHCYFRSQ